MATALTSGELTKLRSSSGVHATKTYLSIIEPTTIGTAQINQTTFTNPIAELTIDNLSVDFTTDVKVGHTVWVGTSAGAYDVGIFRVRKAPTSTKLYVAEMSTGDMGLLSSGALEDLDDNYHITVVDDFNIWSVYSRIAFNGGGTFYKDYDTAYVDQNETSGTRVVLKLGNNQAGFVDPSTSKLTVSMTASIEDLGSGVTVSAYSWNIADGTLTSGSLSSATWGGTFDAGQRWVSCTVTLSNGETVTGYRVIKSHDTSTNAPLALTVTSDRRTRDGRRMVFQLPADTLTSTDVPKGTMVIVWEESEWNDGTVDSAITQFVGWVTRVDSNAQLDGRITTIEAISALELSKSLGFVTQQLTVADSPSNWTEVEDTLAHTEYYVFYLLYWHTNLLTLFDLNLLGSYNSYSYQAFSSSSNNLVDALNENLHRINAYIGQDSDGTLYVTREPSHMTTSERNALTERMTIDEQDITAVASVSGSFRPPIAQVRAYGSYWNSSTVIPFVSYAPGVSRGQGVGIESLEGQLVTGQSDLNTRASNQYAMLNNPYERIVLEMVGNYDVFSVADVAWIRLNVGTDYFPTGEAFNKRCIPEEVSVRYGLDGSKVVSLTLRAETSGINAPAEEVPVIIGNDDNIYELPLPSFDINTGLLTFDYTPYSYNLPDFGTEETTYDIGESPANKIVFAWAGTKLAYMYPQERRWHLLDDFGTDIDDIVFDESSSLLTTNREDGKLGLYIAKGNLVLSSDILKDSPSYAVLESLDFTNIRYSRSDGHYAGFRASGVTVGESFASSKVLDSSTPSDTIGYFSLEINNLGVAGTVSDGTYTYDAAYRTNDGWVTKERFNIFKVDGTYIHPSNPEYNESHEYRFCIEYPSATVGISYDLPGGYSSGSLTVTRYDLIASNNWRYNGSAGLTDARCPYYGIDTADFFSFALAAHGNTMKHRIVGGTSAVIATGLTSISHYGMIPIIRIPYRQISSTKALNNQTDGLDAIYGINRITSGNESLWKINIDTTVSPVGINSETDITPFIGGEYYHCIFNHNSIEINPADAQVMMGWMEAQRGQGGSTLILTTDGGDTWAKTGTVVQTGSTVFWESLNAAWLSGTDFSTDNGIGVYYTPDRGETIYDYTFDWDTVIGERPILGVKVVKL